MRSRYLLIIALIAAAFAAVLVLMAANSIPAVTLVLSNTRSEQSTRTEAKTDVGSRNSSTALPTPPNARPVQDGPSLLQAHCTKCHQFQWLQGVKKTPTQWEKVLSMMEVRANISEPEKKVLLDYLTRVNQP
jgi:hypothetical protein